MDATVRSSMSNLPGSSRSCTKRRHSALMAGPGSSSGATLETRDLACAAASRHSGDSALIDRNSELMAASSRLLLLADALSLLLVPLLLAVLPGLAGDWRPCDMVSMMP